MAYDLIVIGGGMAGLRAGSVAASAGASVLLLEKAVAIGGSAWLSAGMFWLPPTFEAYLEHVPSGDQALARAVLDAYDDDLADVRASGAPVATEPHTKVMGWARGYSTEIRSYLTAMRDALLRSGGTIRTGAPATGLARSGEGWRVTAAVDGAPASFEARAVVLASGGFQGSDAMRAALMPEIAPDILVRSNPAASATAFASPATPARAEAGDFGTYYGHLIPSPISPWSSDRFFHYSIYFSSHSLLVAADGRRISDESVATRWSIRISATSTECADG